MRLSNANLAAGMLVFADSGKVFPGACRLAGHAVFGLMIVVALGLAIVCAEHRLAASYRGGRSWRCAAATCGIAFLMTLALAAIGADKTLGNIILFRVFDRESLAIWIALLSAKTLPLFLLMAEPLEPRPARRR